MFWKEYTDKQETCILQKWGKKCQIEGKIFKANNATEHIYWMSASPYAHLHWHLGLGNKANRNKDTSNIFSWSF